MYYYPISRNKINTLCFIISHFFKIIVFHFIMTFLSWNNFPHFTSSPVLKSGKLFLKLGKFGDDSTLQDTNSLSTYVTLMTFPMSGWHFSLTASLFHTSAWLQTYVRARTFHFSNPFALDEPAVFFVKSGNSFDWRDITGKTIGFGAGWVWDEFCVAREPKIKVSRIILCNTYSKAGLCGPAAPSYMEMQPWIMKKWVFSMDLVGLHQRL